MIKDDEIDLTEHRDFRGDTSSLLFIREENGVYVNNEDFFRRMFHKKLYGDLPWSVKLKDELYKFDGLVALGNKEQRKMAIEVRYWGSSENVSCDCCGKGYIKIPWNHHYGLCKKCKEENNRLKVSTRLWWMERI